MNNFNPVQDQSADYLVSGSLANALIADLNRLPESKQENFTADYHNPHLVGVVNTAGAVRDAGRIMGIKGQAVKPSEIGATSADPKNWYSLPRIFEVEDYAPATHLDNFVVLFQPLPATDSVVIPALIGGAVKMKVNIIDKTQRFARIPYGGDGSKLESAHFGEFLIISQPETDGVPDTGEQYCEIKFCDNRDWFWAQLSETINVQEGNLLDPSSFASTDGILQLQTPTVDNSTRSVIAVSPASAYGDYFRVSRGSHRPTYIQYEGTAPVPGTDTIGTQAGSLLGKTGNEGYTVHGAEVDTTLPGSGVRGCPFRSRGVFWYYNNGYANHFSEKNNVIKKQISNSLDQLIDDGGTGWSVSWGGKRPMPIRSGGKTFQLCYRIESSYICYVCWVELVNGKYANPGNPFAIESSYRYNNLPYKLTCFYDGEQDYPSFVYLDRNVNNYTILKRADYDGADISTSILKIFDNSMIAYNYYSIYGENPGYQVTKEIPSTGSYPDIVEYSGGFIISIQNSYGYGDDYYKYCFQASFALQCYKISYSGSLVNTIDMLSALPANLGDVYTDFHLIDLYYRYNDNAYVFFSYTALIDGTYRSTGYLIGTDGSMLSYQDYQRIILPSYAYMFGNYCFNAWVLTSEGNSLGYFVTKLTGKTTFEYITIPYNDNGTIVNAKIKQNAYNSSPSYCVLNDGTLLSYGYLDTTGLSNPPVNPLVYYYLNIATGEVTRYFTDFTSNQPQPGEKFFYPTNPAKYNYTNNL